jgi:hypothetical protein
MDMRFHWLRDREAQGQFKIYWRLGGTNLADYFMKHHPPAHHVNVRAEFLTKVQDLAEIRHMKTEGQTKTERQNGRTAERQKSRTVKRQNDKIAMLQGRVRRQNGRTAERQNSRMVKRQNDKIAMLQGCVRQASLRELAQRILAREKFKFSPRRFAKQATIKLDS